jgi:hypothetical protein
MGHRCCGKQAGQQPLVTTTGSKALGMTSFLFRYHLLVNFHSHATHLSFLPRNSTLVVSTA